MENPLDGLDEAELASFERRLDELETIAVSTVTASPPPPTSTTTSINNVTSNSVNSAVNQSNSSEESILVIDSGNDKNSPLTCIDLTANDDQSGDIIIEKHVGSTRSNRLRRNRLRGNANPSTLDNTIIIDDDRPEQVTTTRNPTVLSRIPTVLSTRFLTQSLIRPFPEMPATSRHSATTYHGPSPPKRTRLSSKEKKLVEQAKGIHQAKPSTPPPSSDTNIPEISCPICLENLAELKSHNKRLKSTTCGHILCNVCLDATFKSGNGAKTICCPTCRTKLTKAKIHDLFI